MSEKEIYEKVQERYGSAAKCKDDNHGDKIAKVFGYSEEELKSIPRHANLGLSCGNPLALAKLKEVVLKILYLLLCSRHYLTVTQGETVIDLGSGAGFDVLLAAKKVGSSGKVIGVDFNKDMVKRANQNKEKVETNNVSFIESFITDIPLPDTTVDCVISNCVINLVPESDKQNVFNEIYRLLRPGGRVAISDILAKHELPEHVKSNMALYVGCIAGASRVEDYKKYLREAGFAGKDQKLQHATPLSYNKCSDFGLYWPDILLHDSGTDLNIYNTAKGDIKNCKCCGEGVENACCEKTATCCSGLNPASGRSFNPISSDLENVDFNELAGAFKIYAIKA
ncbi:hypothetical protein LTR84_003712 [Exophiala bonariae]|uniref:Arsenite methyltransferase n=1 Tax=Exophiala bonariae TaxID=1690606 RepID=A0AAV9NAK4_9EURO|nr:hypothetical protein LTR84_003712 [Exophiala bonariae]